MIPVADDARRSDQSAQTSAATRDPDHSSVRTQAPAAVPLDPVKRVQSMTEAAQESLDTRTLVLEKPAPEKPAHLAESSIGSSSAVPGTPTSKADPIDEIPDESRCGFIPGYSLLGRLGRGGMGVVYQAIQERLQRVVAIKVLRPIQGREEESVQRFKSEAMALARLHHPNIVAAYDYGEAMGKLYLVLEYVEGMDCAEAIEMHGKFPEHRALSIARDAVLGLSHALKAGIIHRDVKPANLILVAQTDQDASRGAFSTTVKVTDLGLARMVADELEHRPQDLTSAGMIVGTPCYMAPEQARAESVDFRGDIYGLGATLYHMVTGEKPFTGQSWVDVLDRKCAPEAAISHPQDICGDLSDGTARILDRMLAFRAAQRYPSYEDLLTDIQLVLSGHSPKTPPVDRAESSLRPRQRRRLSLVVRRRTTPAPASPHHAPFYLPHRRGFAEVATSIAVLIAAVSIGVMLGRWLLP